jgi:hypothetical protein
MKVRGEGNELLAGITQAAKKLQWKRGDHLAWTTVDGDLIIRNMDRKSTERKNKAWWEK